MGDACFLWHYIINERKYLQKLGKGFLSFKQDWWWQMCKTISKYSLVEFKCRRSINLHLFFLKQAYTTLFTIAYEILRYKSKRTFTCPWIVLLEMFCNTLSSFTLSFKHAIFGYLIWKKKKKHVNAGVNVHRRHFRLTVIRSARPQAHIIITSESGIMHSYWRQNLWKQFPNQLSTILFVVFEQMLL